MPICHIPTENINKIELELKKALFGDFFLNIELLQFAEMLFDFL